MAIYKTINLHLNKLKNIYRNKNNQLINKLADNSNQLIKSV